LWLKELETYIPYPPMQDPATYNLEQVVRQVQQMRRDDRFLPSRSWPRLASLGVEARRCRRLGGMLRA
jgi:hypothetical protein